MSKKTFKHFFVFAISCFICSQAMGAFTLSGTRIIFPQGQNTTSFEITNNAGQTYGGQVWVDNGDNSKGIYIIPQPAFFKVESGLKQMVRLIRTADARLPEDRESLFWLTVQEIPPVAKIAEGKNSGVTSVAMGTRVKVLYRPTSLKDGRKDAEKKMELVQDGQTSVLKNATPYYMAVVGLRVDGRLLRMNRDIQRQLGSMAPFSEIRLGEKLNGKVTVEAIDDWGAVRSYTIRH
ncbi:TPA: fimbrial chaperone [Escherichia coli]|uniref:fimbrial chaperone n=1 Tax=Escherichia coli TaxID=562 RepID=UPI0019C4DF96|nr:fimbrial chaperone [Escherichia coli]CAD6074530.1 putative fimbrial assembly chaperone FanE [Escherichia coli]CAD6549548.1 putative fimbrial assembly chaperone FanE [Escherichia coli]